MSKSFRIFIYKQNALNGNKHANSDKDGLPTTNKKFENFMTLETFKVIQDITIFLFEEQRC